jgi:hypothetical protein
MRNSGIAPYTPMMWIDPIITASDPAPIRNSLKDRLSMYGSVDRDGMLDFLTQRTITQNAQMSMPADNQKGNAPPPGPSPEIQPMGSSALFHIR